MTFILLSELFNELIRLRLVPSCSLAFPRTKMSLIIFILIIFNQIIFVNKNLCTNGWLEWFLFKQNLFNIQVAFVQTATVEMASNEIVQMILHKWLFVYLLYKWLVSNHFFKMPFAQVTFSNDLLKVFLVKWLVSYILFRKTLFIFT